MKSNSEPDDGSRKTLDEIRREIDAEYGFTAPEFVASDTRAMTDEAADVPPRPERLTAPRQTPRARRDERHDVADERLQERFERRQVSVARRALGDEQPRRSGYLLAALAGCVGGQALLLGFFIVMQQRLSADTLRTSAVAPPRIEALAPTPPAPKDEPAPLSEEAAPSTEETPQSTGSIPPDVAPPAASVQSSRAATPPPPTDLPARPTPSAASRTAIPSTTSTPSVNRSRPSEPARLRMTEEPRTAPARRPAAAGATDMAEAQSRLRSALNEWLRASGRGAPVHATEPVIVLSHDGRSAKTYVSVASPVGLVPREQRWELGARGWNLMDDRQAGLPRPAPANSSR